jgi:hypothetical protein
MATAIEELKNRIEVEDLEKIIKKLEWGYEYHKKAANDEYRQLEKHREKLAIKRIEGMKYDIPKYVSKLERLKKFLEEFVSEYPSKNLVKYTFKKIKEPYIDDFHDIIPDPLEYKLAEYNLLDIDNYIEIVFDYYSEGLRNFIEKWMTENVDYAEQEISTESLFRLKTNL